MDKGFGPDPDLVATRPEALRASALTGNDPGYALGVLAWPSEGFSLRGAFTMLAIVGSLWGFLVITSPAATSTTATGPSTLAGEGVGQGANQ